MRLFFFPPGTDCLECEPYTEKIGSDAALWREGKTSLWSSSAFVGIRLPTGCPNCGSSISVTAASPMAVQTSQTKGVAPPQRQNTSPSLSLGEGSAFQGRALGLDAGESTPRSAVVRPQPAAVAAPVLHMLPDPGHTGTQQERHPNRRCPTRRVPDLSTKWMVRITSAAWRRACMSSLNTAIVKDCQKHQAKHACAPMHMMHSV